MPAPDLSTLREVYLDESSQTKHRYLLIGGIAVNAEMVADVEEALRVARLPELPNGEAAWTKVSPAKLAAYRRMVDLFFDNPHRFAPFEFHSLAVDTHRIDDRRHNDGSREIGFNKEIYQICMKFRRLYSDRLFHVYPDFRQTSQAPEDLRLMLNRGAHKVGDPRDWPFRRLHFRDSCTVQIMQLVDVMLGGVAYCLNGHIDKPDASPAKSDLARHILERARIHDVTRDTAIRGKFTVWHRVLN